MSIALPKASEIKVIVTEYLDGTLLNAKGKVSERTQKVIRAVLAKYPEMHFIMASGRGKPSTLPIREALGLEHRPHTESILNNGCVIYGSDGKILWQSTLPPTFLHKVHQTLDPASPDYVYFYSVGDDAVLFNETWARSLNEEYDEQTVVADLNDFIRKVEAGEAGVNKLGFLESDPSKIEEIKGKVEGFRKEYNLNWSFAAPIFLEYMPSDRNKGISLKQLLDHLGLEEREVLAFGDGGNDITLFEKAGWPVAMANACDELKSYAKFITKSNVEDGVADMLERIFLKDELLN